MHVCICKQKICTQNWVADGMAKCLLVQRAVLTSPATCEQALRVVFSCTAGLRLAKNAQWVKPLLPKSDNLSSNPGSTWWKNGFDFHMHPMTATHLPHAQTNQLINKCKKFTLCVCVFECVHAHTYIQKQEKLCCISWSWNYKRLWTTLYRC